MLTNPTPTSMTTVTLTTGESAVLIDELQNSADSYAKELETCTPHRKFFVLLRLTLIQEILEKSTPQRVR